MMFLDLDNVLLKYAVQFISYFIFSFTGALLKEMHYANTTKDKTYEFTAYKVVAGTVVGTVLSMALRDYFMDTIISHWENMAFISLVLGLIGFELFTKLSSLAGIKSLIKEVKGTASDVQETKESIKATISSEPLSVNKDNYKSYQHIEGVVHDNSKKEEDD